MLSAIALFAPACLLLQIGMGEERKDTKRKGKKEEGIKGQSHSGHMIQSSFTSCKPGRGGGKKKKKKKKKTFGREKG